MPYNRDTAFYRHYRLLNKYFNISMSYLILIYWSYSGLFVCLLFRFLRQGFSVLPWSLFWNLLCRPDWPWTHRDLLAFASQVLRLKARTTNALILLIFKNERAKFRLQPVWYDYLLKVSNNFKLEFLKYQQLWQISYEISGVHYHNNSGTWIDSVDNLAKVLQHLIC